MQQLGASFVQSFLVPYIETNILGNVDKDERLQHVIRYDTTPTATDISGLETSYFSNTGTILDTDLALRKVFFKEFIGFINRQKIIADGNVYKLASRLLPNPRTKEYTNEAQNNIRKFGFEAVDAIQQHIAAELIRQKLASGEIKKEEADDQKSKLKEGKIILVRGKDENFKTKSEDDIKRALASQERARDFWEDVLSGDGGIAYGMNPLDIPEEGEKEKGSTLTGLQKQVWASMAIKAEKQLEENGIYVEASLKIDQNGVAYGNVQDRRGAKMKVEVSLIKPGKHNYKFTFSNQPSKKFLVDEDELKSEFKDKKRSAAEVYTDKQLQERKREELIGKVGIPVSEGVKFSQTPPKVARGYTEKVESKVPEGGEEYEGAVPVAVATGKKAELEAETGSGITEGAGYPSGPVEAKQVYDQRLSQRTKTEVRSRDNKKRGRKRNWRDTKASARAFRNTPTARIIKYYAATAAGFGGAVGIYSFLT